MSNMGGDRLDKFHNNDRMCNIQNQSTIKEGTQEGIKKTLELIDSKKRLLWEIATKFFHSRYLSNYCWKGRQQCTDWSDLYILTKEWLAKVWCWEFNSDTFINGQYDRYHKEYLEGRNNFKESPLPLYVVNQTDSYLASWKLKDLMSDDPKLYLEQYSVLVFNPNEEDWKKTSTYSWSNNYTEKFHIDENSISSLDDTILAFRNLYFRSFDKNILCEYMNYLQTLSIDELIDYAKNSDTIENQTHKEIWNIIYNKLWWTIVWAGIYAKEAIESRKKIIDSFDTRQQKFTHLPDFKD